MKLIYRPAAFLLFGLGCLVLQGGVLKVLLPGIVVPNLLLITVVYLAFFDVSIGGAILAFCLGLIADFGSGILLGPAAGSFVAVYGILSVLSQRLFIDSVLPATVAVAGSSILYSLVYMLLMLEAKGVSGVTFSAALLEAILTGMCAAPVLYLLKKLFGSRRAGERDY